MVFQVKAMNQSSHLMYGTSNKTLYLMMSQLAKYMKLSKLRFYIATQPKPQLGEDASTTESEHNDESSFEDQDEIIEVSDNQSLSRESSYSAQGQDQDQVSLHHPGATDHSLPTDHVTDYPVVSEIHFIVPEILQEDAVVLQDVTYLRP